MLINGRPQVIFAANYAEFEAHNNLNIIELAQNELAIIKRLTN